ncbi:hypothetical protein [Microtetraspora malaysiensis]|uniref:Growth inhibitor PemK n=1 Tax=Microtetraspora malaysiensis TaxID=161358 RepID=A0ABW6SNE8_9ACTN
MTQPSNITYGGVYLYSPKGINRERAVLVVAARGILAHPGRRWIPALEVKPHDDGDLLTVAIDVPGVGRRYVNAGNIQRILRDWLVTDSDAHLGTVAVDDMEAVRDMLAAVFDL